MRKGLEDKINSGNDAAFGFSGIDQIDIEIFTRK